MKRIMGGLTMKDQPKTLGAYIARARMEMEARYPEVDDELCAAVLDGINEFENELVKLIRFDSPVIEREDGPTLVVTKEAVEKLARVLFSRRWPGGTWGASDITNASKQKVSEDDARAVLCGLNIEVAEGVVDGWVCSHTYGDNETEAELTAPLDPEEYQDGQRVRIAVLRPKEGE